MKGLRQQQGVTGITMILVAGLVVFFALIAIRLFPVYLEHYKVTSHLQALAEQSDTAKMSDAEIRKALLRRFDIDDVEHVTKDDIYIEHPDKNTTVIAVEYEVRTPAFGNVDMLVSFNDEVEVHP